MPRRACTCPPMGSPLCERCAWLLARANNCPVEAPGSFVEAPGVGGGLSAKVSPPGALGGAERAFQTRVVALAKASGWLVYFTHRSDHSPAGYPDLTLAKPGRLLFLELKSSGGKLSAAQSTWLEMLKHSVPGVEVAVVRPADWPVIVETLQR